MTFLCWGEGGGGGAATRHRDFLSTNCLFRSSGTGAGGGSLTKTSGERSRLNFKIACKIRSFTITTQCRTFSTRELRAKIATVSLNTVIGLQNK